MASENPNRVTTFHAGIIIGMVFWTGILAGLFYWAVLEEREHFTESIKLKAESLAQHNQALRRWIGGHGGVYVEVDATITPNPLLAHVPERDVETPSGRKLTLLNSPAVLREIFKEFERGTGDRVRLVSNTPMNPSNVPDEWEKAALDTLEAGAAKAEAVITAGKETYFRLMYPMEIKSKCLVCHHYPSARPQKVVGGLSVTVDKTPYDRLRDKVLRQISIGYFGVWVIGLLGLVGFDMGGARLLRDVERMATHDGLTGLINRQEIDRLLHNECDRADRYEKTLAVLMLDIDHFKRVNDTYGHQVGDEALRVVADTIRQTIRKTDIAGRYGGEELLVMAPEIACEEAIILAQRLNAAIKQAPIALNDGTTFSVEVSIGVACRNPERNTAESLVKHADNALYQAKETGRDRVCVASP